MTEIIGGINYTKLAKKLKIEKIDNLDVFLSSRASESTLSDIKNKISKCDTDNIGIVSDSIGLLKTTELDIDINKRLGIRIENDNVGIATEYSLSEIKSQISKLQFDDKNFLRISPGNPPNFDISLSNLVDTLKSTRATPTQELSATSINAGETYNINKNNIDNYSAIVVSVRATYDASATQGVRVRWLYSPDGTNYDSIEDVESQGNYEDLSFDVGKTRQKTILIPLLTPYIKIQVVNLDNNYAVSINAWTTLMR